MTRRKPKLCNKCLRENPINIVVHSLSYFEHNSMRNDMQNLMLCNDCFNEYRSLLSIIMSKFWADTKKEIVK